MFLFFNLSFVNSQYTYFIEVVQKYNLMELYDSVENNKLSPVLAKQFEWYGPAKYQNSINLKTIVNYFLEATNQIIYKNKIMTENFCIKTITINLYKQSLCEEMSEESGLINNQNFILNTKIKQRKIDFDYFLTKKKCDFSAYNIHTREDLYQHIYAGFNAKIPFHLIMILIDELLEEEIISIKSLFWNILMEFENIQDKTIDIYI